MALSDTDLRRIRAEVGTSPSDDDLADRWADAETDGVDTTVRWAAVAAQVLGERLADQYGGSLTVSIPGAISVGMSTSTSAALAAQVQRLRGIAGLTAVGGLTGGVLTRPSSRSRLDHPVYPPRI